MSTNFIPYKEGPSVDWVLGKELRLQILSNWYDVIDLNDESDEVQSLRTMYWWASKKFFPDLTQVEVSEMVRQFNIEVMS